MSGVQPQFYWGAQNASSSTNDENSLQFIIHRLMNRRTHVELVQVKSVTNTPGQLAAVGRVDVLPLVNEIDGYGNARPHDTVYGLNYFRFAGGNNAVILDPQVGDIGFAVICDKDTSVVRKTLAQGNPGSRARSRREHGIYCGLCLGNAGPTQYIAFLEKGIHIQDAYGNVMQFGQNGVTINGVLITTTGDVVTSLGKNNIILSQHEHSNVLSGGGQSGPPVPNT